MSDESSWKKWFLAVLEEYEQALVRYATRLTGSMERGRDVVQETFLTLLRERPSPDNVRIAPWLFTVCRNKSFDLRRKEKRMVMDMAHEEIPDESLPPPDAALCAAQEHKRALLLLNELTEKQQEVIRLKFQNGLSYKEISQVTGHSLSNVGVLIHTGIKKLRAEYREQENGAKSKGGEK